MLIQAVGRNKDRFPEDFMFRLTKEEFSRLRSQIVTSNEGRGGRRYPPYAVTEQGVAMLSSVLRSARAVQVNIEHGEALPPALRKTRLGGTKFRIPVAVA